MAGRVEQQKLRRRLQAVGSGDMGRGRASGDAEQAGERAESKEGAVEAGHAPRSARIRATLARSSGTPRSSRLDVIRISG